MSKHIYEWKLKACNELQAMKFSQSTFLWKSDL